MRGEAMFDPTGRYRYLLRRTRAGAPRHPLYLRRDERLVRFSGR